VSFCRFVTVVAPDQQQKQPLDKLKRAA